MLRGLTKEAPRWMLAMTPQQRAQLEAAAAASRGCGAGGGIRPSCCWRPGQRRPPWPTRCTAVAPASMPGQRAWRRGGVAGLGEGDHGGGQSQAGRGRGGACWRAAGDRIPKRTATGHGLDGTALRTELAQAGYAVGDAPSAAPCTGWGIAGNGPSTSWVGPIRPTPKKGGVIAQAQADARRRRGGLGGR